MGGGGLWHGGGGGGGGQVLPRDLGPVSINTKAVPPGVGPFCHGQITWEDGPSPRRTVRHAPRPIDLIGAPIFVHIDGCFGGLCSLDRSDREAESRTAYGIGVCQINLPHPQTKTRPPPPPPHTHTHRPRPEHAGQAFHHVQNSALLCIHYIILDEMFRTLLEPVVFLMGPP